MATQFSKKDILIILMGIIGLVVFLMFYEKASPTASVNLQVSRHQALQIAREYLEKQRFSLEDYDQTVIFNQNGDGAIYLQKTLGMDQYNKLAQELHLRYWQIRFTKQLQKEEFQVFVDPQGKVASFVHYIPEDAEGANLKEAEAFKLAQAFLRLQQDIDLAKYTLVDSSTKKRDRRTDHFFAWRESARQFGEAKLRMSIVIHGNVVDWYGQYLEVPEKFSRAYQAEGTKGDLLTSISDIFSSFLTMAAIIVFLIAYKNTGIPWKGALILTLIIVTASLFEDINSIPIMKFDYSTESSLYTFWGQRALGIVQSALWIGGKTFLFAIAGWAVCREVFKGKRAHWLPEGKTWLCPDFAHASFMGYILACISLGYTTAFYLIGEKYLGVWSPVESSYSNMLGTWLPFFDPLTKSFQAAVLEELMYRFFAIALLMRYLRVPALAFLIPAMIWGFSHSGYAVSPFYTRGIELTIAGLVFCYFFLKYSLVAVIIAHYVYDAVMIGMPLLQSSNLYLFWSGIGVAGVIGVPMILGLAGFWRREYSETVIGYKDT